ncbi:MAG: hypothetical protein HY905_18230 [Deltaproteobacteria bacterium]|nr:hypothetical protein [Deltaproteobacteria bacterium]
MEQRIKSATALPTGSGAAPFLLAAACALLLAASAAAQDNLSFGGRVETDLYVDESSSPDALLDGDEGTHFAQHRLLDSDWRVWLRAPARLVRVNVVQGWSDWDQVTRMRLETADGSAAEFDVVPGTRDEQSFDLDFADPTAFVDVRILAVDDHGDDNDWGGFAEMRFDGTAVEGTDTAAPAISNVRVERTSDTAATIRWTTDEPATSQVRFSTESTVVATTVPDLTLVTEHAVTVAGDAPLRGFLELRSADGAGHRGEARDAAFATIDTAFEWGVGGWSFQLGGRWRPAPEVFAEDGVSAMGFVQAWIGGDGWTTWFDAEDVRTMVDAGYTPDVIHYFFGDPTLEQVEAEREAFLADIRTLAQLLADSGVGDRTMVTLEPEFNQDGIPSWDGWNDLTIEAMRILRETAGTKVGLLAGDWDIDHLLPVCMGRAAAYSDFVAFQEMRASTRDTSEEAYDVVDRAIRFSHYLARTFLRPVRWGYVMVSDYGGWLEVQRRVVAELCERAGELQANAVTAISWMSYMDNEAGGGYFGEAESHKGLRFAWGTAKPAFFLWRECVNNGPTWLETDEWPAGGGPVEDGCGCRATGTDRGAGSGLVLLALSAAMVWVRRKR